MAMRGKKPPGSSGAGRRAIAAGAAGKPDAKSRGRARPRESSVLLQERVMADLFNANLLCVDIAAKEFWAAGQKVFGRAGMSFGSVLDIAAQAYTDAFLQWMPGRGCSFKSFAIGRVRQALRRRGYSAMKLKHGTTLTDDFHWLRPPKKGGLSGRELAELRGEIAKALNGLKGVSRKSRAVFLDRFGLGEGGEPLSFQEIARKYKYSHEKAPAFLVQRILGKLRASPNAKKLRVFLE